MAVTFATLSFEVSGNFNVLVFAVVFSIVSFSMVYYLGFFVIFLLLGCLTPSCMRFLNYFKEGEETFCSLNVYFS